MIRDGSNIMGTRLVCTICGKKYNSCLDVPEMCFLEQCRENEK